MKYIRTKDGRIYLINEKKTNDSYCVIDNNEERYIPRDDWFDSAYTIEELCDEFVVIVDGKHYIRVPAGNPNFPTYGAIWTTGEHGEPILKSVAKMNGKGELELL